jgi:acetyl-CoA synthetase
LAGLAAVRGAAPRGVAVMTCSGGDSAIAADLAARLGVELPAPAAGTVARLEAVLPAAATAANPLDYTSLLWDDVAALREVSSALQDDPAVGRVLVLFDAYDGPAPILEAIAGQDVVLAATLPELAAEGAVGGIRAGLLAAAAPEPTAARVREIAGARRARAGAPVEEPAAKALLRDAGVPVPLGRVACDADDAVALWRELGGPVAMKAIGLRHKARAGGLALHVDDEDAVRAAFARGLTFVEEMVAPGLELLVSVDRTGFVPVLVVGLGGVYAELLDRVEIHPLPVARERIDPRVAEIAMALQALPVALIELNPVIVGAQGAVAVDALCDEELTT